MKVPSLQLYPTLPALIPQPSPSTISIIVHLFTSPLTQKLGIEHLLLTNPGHSVVNNSMQTLPPEVYSAMSGGVLDIDLRARQINVVRLHM